MEKVNVLIIGAKQHAEVMCDTLTTQKNSRNVNVVGYLDDNPNLQGKKVLGYPVLGTLDNFDKIVKEKYIGAVFLGISARHIKVREKIQHKIMEKNLFTKNAVHKTAYISSRANVGMGNFFAPNVVINCFTEVGCNCVFYSGTCIDHHTKLGNNIYCGPNVSMAADIKIGDNTYIGISASIMPHIKVGKNVTIGAGCVVIKDIPDNAVVVGVPGKIIRYND